MTHRFWRCSGSRESIHTLIRRPVCCHAAPSLRVNPMPPYSDAEPEILQERFPQQSRRRAAVKISVPQLRMKFSAGSVECVPAARRPAATSVCPKHQMFYARVSSSGMCFAPKTNTQMSCRDCQHSPIRVSLGAKRAWVRLRCLRGG